MHSTRCVVRKYVDIGGKRGLGEPWRSPTRRLLSAQKLSLDSLSFRVLVQAQLLQHPGHCAVQAWLGLEQRGTCLGLGVLDSHGLLNDVGYELSPQCVGPRALHGGLLHGGVANAAAHRSKTADSHR